MSFYTSKQEMQTVGLEVHGGYHGWWMTQALTGSASVAYKSVSMGLGLFT